MLTVFANLRINNVEQFQHLKDSFFSFNRISDNWLVNIRGTLREDVISFLKIELGNKIVLFEMFEGRRNWFQDSLNMLKEIKYNHLLLWNEDHINIAHQNIYKDIVREMKEEQIDYLLCTWWLDGEHQFLFEVDKVKYHKYINSIQLTKKFWQRQLKKGYDKGLVVGMGIFEKKFFEKLLKKEKYKLPKRITDYLFLIMIVFSKIKLRFDHRKCFYLINRLCFYKLNRFTAEGPFNIEKEGYRLDMLPFKIGFSKQELFACIDDDLKNIGIPGYQLIKRGMYPLSFSVQIGKINDNDSKEMEINDDYKILKLFLLSGQERCIAYYEDTPRIQSLPKETIIIISGKVSVQTGGKSIHLLANEMVSMHSNIGYVVTATIDSNLIIVSPSLKNKKIRYLNQKELQQRKLC